VTSKLIALAIAKPIPNWRTGGIAIPLAKHFSFPNDNKGIGLDAITSHGISIREKIISGLDNYEMNTGTMHPFAVKQNDYESGLGTRGALPLKIDRLETWMGEISIGTPPKTLNIHIDTGAADMWVLPTGCAGISADHNLWDPHSSASAVKQQRFRLKYADGSKVKGDLYADNVTIAGLTADRQIFGSATSYTSQLQNNEYYADGLLGLAYPDISKLRVSPLFITIARQNKLINPAFSLKLTSPGAEMYIGEANSMLYNGDITYARVTSPAFWQVSMDDVSTNGKKILENIPAMFDTGANYIFGDWDRVAELYKRLGGTLQERQGFGYYYLPCNSLPTVSFTFGGRSFEIPPEVLKLEPVEEGSLNCFCTIIGHRPISEISKLITS